FARSLPPRCKPSSLSSVYPPLPDSKFVGDQPGNDISRSSGYGAPWMGCGTRHIQALYGRTIAEMTVHDLIGRQRTHENVAVTHVGQVMHVFLRGVHIHTKYVVASHIGAVLGPSVDHLLCELGLEFLEALPVQIGTVRHDVPCIGYVLAFGRQRRIEHAKRSGAKLDDFRY